MHGRSRPRRRASRSLARRARCESLHGHEVVAAHGLAAIGLRALRRLLEQPIDVAVEGFEGVSGGVAAGLLEDALGFAGDHERLHRLFGHVWPPRPRWAAYLYQMRRVPSPGPSAPACQPNQKTAAVITDSTVTTPIRESTA